MKVKIPEISWHNRDPVLSVDIQAQPLIRNGKSDHVGSNDADVDGDGVSSTFRLASGGTDTHVLIWYITLIGSDSSDIKLELVADLKRHQRAVNVVRWSPNGALLASGDDECVIMLWKRKSDHEPLNILMEANNDADDKEVWLIAKVLRGHLEDVYDLSWSANSLYLASASVDNSVIVWDVEKGKLMYILHDHKGFVQGIAWDPKDKFLATLSTDRSMRIFDIQTRKLLCHTCKSVLPVGSAHILYEKPVRLFHDDTLQTFFRRLNFSPDGKLLIAPAGVIDYDGVTKLENFSYVFSRTNFRQPVMMLPCPAEYAVAVRFCPLLFKLRPFNAEQNPPMVPLPYRMIFAVATKRSVYFYDTQQRLPFAIISNIHYTRLTDITWSTDGCLVVASSTDGFCSLIAFAKKELGEEYDSSEKTSTSYSSDIKKKETVNVNEEVTTKTSPNKSETSKDSKILQSTTSTTTTNEDNNNLVIIKKIPLNDARESYGSVNTPAATPIAIKRKSSEHLVNNGNTVITAGNDLKLEQTQEQEQEQEQQPKIEDSSKLPVRSLATDLIVDKEILSSDEKFELPEKNRPITPISIRRHPRNFEETHEHCMTSKLSGKSPSLLSSPSTEKKVKQQATANQNPKHSSPLEAKKKPTPIAIRRTPRVIMPLPTPNSGVITEEAMDAWPLDKQAKAKQQETNEAGNSIKETVVVKAAENGSIEKPVSGQNGHIETGTMERTEDIRLVYEETVEENRSIPNKVDGTKKSGEETELYMN